MACGGNPTWISSRCTNPSQGICKVVGICSFLLLSPNSNFSKCLLIWKWKQTKDFLWNFFFNLLLKYNIHIESPIAGYIHFIGKAHEKSWLAATSKCLWWSAQRASDHHHYVLYPAQRLYVAGTSKSFVEPLYLVLWMQFICKYPRITYIHCDRDSRDWPGLRKSIIYVEIVNWWLKNINNNYP